ncbi:MAG: helix-turn-helix domain-containing protein [Deltaproteobacteria bacterium]|nr:helix-turn-helix domain-containing protein [Deltaproteobacteria bacterium]
MTKGEFRKLRESIGYSQARLSIEMDVTIRTISRWENGEVKTPKVVEIAIKALVRDAKKKRRA